MEKNLPAGHPVHTYMLEAELIYNLIDELLAIDPHTDYQKFYNVFNHLATVEKHFARKENQLFPFLEKHGWTNPSQNMWSFHDTIRDIFRLVRKNLEEKDLTAAQTNVHYIADNLGRLLNVEANILFPNALELLPDEDWIAMRQGEEEIGWMLKDEPAPYPNHSDAHSAYVHPAMDTERRTDVQFDTNAAHYDEGYMTIEQVNLLLKTLPIDITFVDEHDRVIFYNRGEERVFPRSAGIIGREVKFCHPPKSVGTVLKIVENFKAGTQNEANFWFNYRGRLIYVRYFAVRDKDKNYKGVIEMSQDITDIQKIQGERRLLEWDS
nr:PAS domain-containing protein [uncultured Capnocytophaga sp.]